MSVTVKVLNAGVFARFGAWRGVHVRGGHSACMLRDVRTVHGVGEGVSACTVHTSSELLCVVRVYVGGMRVAHGEGAACVVGATHCA